MWEYKLDSCGGILWAFNEPSGCIQDLLTTRSIRHEYGRLVCNVMLFAGRCCYFRDLLNELCCLLLDQDKFFAKDLKYFSWFWTCVVGFIVLSLRAVFFVAVSETLRYIIKVRSGHLFQRLTAFIAQASDLLSCSRIYVYFKFPFIFIACWDRFGPLLCWY